MDLDDSKPIPTNHKERIAHFCTFNTFFQSDDLADLTITCHRSSWNVHKLVVSANSDEFKRACLGGFKEASGSTIRLKEEEHRAVDAMVYYMYHGTYQESNHKYGEDLSDLAFNLQVYMVGDKYDVLGLCDAAALGVYHTSPTTKELLDSAQEVYSSEVLRPRFGEDILRKVHVCLPTLSDTERKALNDICRSADYFAVDLLQNSRLYVRSNGEPGEPLPVGSHAYDRERCNRLYIENESWTYDDFVCGACHRGDTS